MDEPQIIEKKLFFSHEQLRDGIVELIDKYGGKVMFYVHKTRLKFGPKTNTSYIVFVVDGLIER